MVWTKVAVPQLGQDFRARYIDSDNQVLEAIDFCRTRKGRILIFTLWDADFPEERRTKVWDLVVTAGLDKTDEVMGPTITSSSAGQREKFLAIIFALGKVELQTKIDICEKFELPFDKIENMSLAMYADSVQEILGIDYADLSRACSPTFFHESSSCSEEELAPDSEEEQDLLSNLSSPFRRSPVRG